MDTFFLLIIRVILWNKIILFKNPNKNCITIDMQKSMKLTNCSLNIIRIFIVPKRDRTP